MYWHGSIQFGVIITVTYSKVVREVVTAGITGDKEDTIFPPHTEIKANLLA